MDLIFIRHASTSWNEMKIYQGRKDIPLSDQGLNDLSKISVPEPFLHWNLYSSPLMRATETARLLFGRQPNVVEAAIEQDFGDWEGRSGPIHPKDEWLGLETPIPGGESIRQVQVRMQTWLQQVHASQPAVLVTHKGVIFAMAALAWNWPVQGKRPFKIDYKKMQHFRICPDGKPEVVQLNVEFSSKV